MGRAAKIGCVGGAFVLVAAGGAGGFLLLHGLGGSDAPKPFSHSPLSDTPPDAGDALKTAGDFLKTWSAGPDDYPEAGAETDAPTTAEAGLREYGRDLRLQSVTFDAITGGDPDPSRPSAAKVAFAVTARTTAGTWKYAGSLQVLRNQAGQRAVHWVPTVLFPGLRPGQHLEEGTVPAPADQVRVFASDGRTELTGAAFPSLADVATTIGRHAGSAQDGDSGSGIAVVDSTGAKVSAAKVFTAPEPARVTTTIDARLERVAEQAVLDPHLGGKPSSVVVLDRHNGHILALAHHGPADDAINAAKAPGSTMKIITSAALFDRAGLNPSSNAPCAKTQVAASEIFHNEDDVPEDTGTTVQQAFAESCNTAFIKDGFHYLVNNGDASALHDEACDVFGMGSWSIGGGVSTADPSIPADPVGGDQAAQFIGQGKVTASPLFLASVAATVGEGAFHQPVILPRAHQVPARRPISASTAAGLRQMMRAVVTGGTATPRLGGLPGVGAKTGTAEEADHTNGWLTAFDADLAVASLVEGGTSGVDSAGYVVRAVLVAGR